MKDEQLKEALLSAISVRSALEQLQVNPDHWKLIDTALPEADHCVRLLENCCSNES